MGVAALPYEVAPEAVEEKRAAEAFTRAVYKELRKAGLEPSKDIQLLRLNTGHTVYRCELCDVSFSVRQFFLGMSWYCGKAYRGVCTDRVACQKRAQVLRDRKTREKRLGKLDPSVVESWRNQWRAIIALSPEPPPKLAALDDDISLQDLMERIERLGPGTRANTPLNRSYVYAALAGLGVALLIAAFAASFV